MNDRPSENHERDEAAVAASSPPAAVEEEVVDAVVVEDEVGDGGPAAAGAAEGGVAGDAGEAPDVEDADAADDPLVVALRERDEYLDLAQRTRADFENFRRRATAQASEAERRGRAAVARNLLPAIDNLQRALAHAGDETAGDVDGLAKGFALVHEEIRSALARSGVEAFDPAGAKFDPNLHEAVSTAPAEGVESGTVLETLELGYLVDDQVIRPARVVVSG